VSPFHPLREVGQVHKVGAEPDGRHQTHRPILFIPSPRIMMSFKLLSLLIRYDLREMGEMKKRIDPLH